MSGIVIIDELVKCEYCDVVQLGRLSCERCSAPLPIYEKVLEREKLRKRIKRTSMLTGRQINTMIESIMSST